MTNAPTNNTPERSDPATVATYNFGDPTANVAGPPFVVGAPLTRPVPLALAELMNAGLASWEPAGLVADDWSIRPATIEGLHAMRRAGFGRLFAWSDWDRSRTAELKRIAEHGSGAEAMAATLLLETDASAAPIGFDGPLTMVKAPDDMGRVNNALTVPPAIGVVLMDRSAEWERDVVNDAWRVVATSTYAENLMEAGGTPSPWSSTECDRAARAEVARRALEQHGEGPTLDLADPNGPPRRVLISEADRRSIDRVAARLGIPVDGYDPSEQLTVTAPPPWRDDVEGEVAIPVRIARALERDWSWIFHAGDWHVVQAGRRPEDEQSFNWSAWDRARRRARTPGYPYDLQAGRSDLHPLESLGYMINRQNQKLRTGTKLGDFRHDATPYFYPAARSSADWKPEDVVKELTSGMDRAQEYRDAQRNRRDTLARAGVKVEGATVANPPIYRMSHHAVRPGDEQANERLLNHGLEFRPPGLSSTFSSEAFYRDVVERERAARADGSVAMVYEDSSRNCRSHVVEAADTNWRNADRAERVNCSQRRNASARVTIAALIVLFLIGAFALTKAVRLLNREPVPIDAVRVR